MRPFRLAIIFLGVCALLVGGCGAPSGTPVDLGGDLAARSWGDGPYGLVLVHDAGRDASSWQPQATELATRGMTVLAPEAARAEAVQAAVEALRAGGVARVAILGAGDGSGPAVSFAREHPDLVDQLIVISASGDATGLADFPKLFVASRGEAAAADAERMAGEASGAWNALFLADGDASGQALFDGSNGDEVLSAVVRRLEERR